MRPCSLSEADLVLDGQPYRIDDLDAFKTLRKRPGRKGVRWVNPAKTENRLRTVRLMGEPKLADEGRGPCQT